MHCRVHNEIGSEIFTRYMGREISWIIAGTILSLLSGAGIICDNYFNK